jgi:energy-coupling factor transporter ATP-binding protein EcfA2
VSVCLKSEAPNLVDEREEALAVLVENVTFTYEGSDRPAIAKISFRQKPGEMVGIVGASGAGKSTLAKCLNYIIPGFEEGRFEGFVRIGGRPLAGGRVSDYAPIVGMVFQDFEAQLFSTNVAHEVAFAMEQVGMDRAQMAARIGPALAAVGLAGFEHRDPTSLSGGEKQRLAIAAVMALRPSVIVMDEPTTDLDPEGKAEVFALIRRMRDEGLSLVVIEHEIEEMRSCDRLIILRNGIIAAEGPPMEILPRPDLLDECGVRQPDFSRLFTRLGMNDYARNVSEAEKILRARHRVGRPLSHSRGEGKKPGTNGRSALVEIDSLRFSYPGGPAVVNDVSLTISSGEFVAIIGQNGSGKTTLAKQIVGLYQPGSGTIRIDGKDRARLTPADSAHLAGYVFQNPDHQIFSATVDEEVEFGPNNFGLDKDEIKRRCDEALTAVGLIEKRSRDPFLLGKGERQRLAVASVLALRPRLLILDEPTTGLDWGEQRRMMGMISDLNRAGTAIVIICHTPWLVAEYAHRVVLMKSGRAIFDGPVRTFFDQEDLIASSSFRMPEITALGRRFGITALSVDELVEFFEAAP